MNAVSEVDKGGDRARLMRASVLLEPGKLEIQRRLRPVPAPDEVLVEVASVGVCGSDTHYFREGRVGDFVVDAPLVLGHEAGGTIVEVGAEIDARRLGQRVSIEPQRPEALSREVLAGRYNLDPAMKFYATPPVDGAFSELVTIQGAFAHPVPDRLSDDAAALMEPLSVAIAAIRKAAVEVGSHVIITGAGPIGLLCGLVARAQGATRVAISDPDPTRRARALELAAATETLAPGTAALPEAQFDAFLECSGAPSAISGGLASVRPAGRVVLVGMGPDGVTMSLPLIQGRELVVTGVFRYTNTWPAAIDLAASGVVDLDALVTGVFSLEDAADALEASSAPEHIKVIVRPGA